MEHRHIPAAKDGSIPDAKTRFRRGQDIFLEDVWYGRCAICGELIRPPKLWYWYRNGLFLPFSACCGVRLPFPLRGLTFALFGLWLARNGPSSPLVFWSANACSRLRCISSSSPASPRPDQFLHPFSSSSGCVSQRFMQTKKEQTRRSALSLGLSPNQYPSDLEAA